jgi:hypothetical protein
MILIKQYQQTRAHWRVGPDRLNPEGAGPFVISEQRQYGGSENIFPKFQCTSFCVRE